MKCLNTSLNSLLLSFMIVIFIQFSFCIKTPDLQEDRTNIPSNYPRSSDHIAYVDFDTTNLDSESRNDYIANFDHYALKLTSKEILLKFRKLLRIEYKDIIIMRGLRVIFNAEEILQRDIFTTTDYDRQEKLDVITNIVKNRYSTRLEHCRFFFSVYTNDQEYFKRPLKLKKYQWIHLNSLCFDSEKLVENFDTEFSYLYMDFLKNTQYSTLKFYDLGNDMYIPVDYKADVMRTNSLKQINDKDNWHKGYLGLDNDEVLVAIANDFSVNNVIYSIPYNKIVDCNENNIIQKEEKDKKCFKFNLQLNGLFSNILTACPQHKTGYQKLLQVKYFSHEFNKKCFGKIDSLIKDTFQNLRDPTDIYNLFELYSDNAISEQIYQFLCNQINMNNSLSDLKKLVVENKIIFLLRHLSKNINDFLSKKFNFGIYKASKEICHNKLKKLLSKSLNKNYKIILNNKEIKPNVLSGPLKTENRIFNSHPPSQGKLNSLYDPSVWKICSSHPNFAECLCKAYPLSMVCKKNNCKDNKFWECNRDFCNNPRNQRSKECECKNNPNSYKCKCKLNPLLKDCFCDKQSKSVYCHKNFCKNDIIRSNHMFCICQRDPKAAICQPQFCLKNLKNPQCKCLVNPKSFGCFCDMLPNSNKCLNGKNQNGYINHLKRLYKDFTFDIDNLDLVIDPQEYEKDSLKEKEIKVNSKSIYKNKTKDYEEDYPLDSDEIERIKKIKALNKNKKKDGEDHEDEMQRIKKIKGLNKNKKKDVELEPEDQDDNQKNKESKNNKNQRNINDTPKKQTQNKSNKNRGEDDTDENDKNNKEELKKTFDFLKSNKDKITKNNISKINKSDKDENDNNSDDEEANKRKQFQKLFSKFRNPSNPNFNNFYKFDENGNIVPKKGLLDVMNPKHPEFNKYYKLNKIGKIVPKMNPNNPNFNLFYKKDDYGNILPRKFLIKKNKNIDQNEEDDKDQDQINNSNNKNPKNSKKKVGETNKSNKIYFNPNSTKTIKFFKLLFGAFSNSNNPNFPDFFEKTKDGDIKPNDSILKLLDPYNSNFKKNFKINSQGRIIPKPDPKSPLFPYFYNLDIKTMNLVPKEHLKKLGLNNKGFNPLYDGKNNVLFSKFNPFGYKGFKPKYKKLEDFLPKNKVLGPGGYFLMPDGRKLGNPFGKLGNDGQFYSLIGKPLLPPLVRLGDDGKLYGPNGKPVGPSAVKGPDGKYYNPQGQVIYPLFGKLGPDGRYYGPDGTPFGPVGKRGDNGKFYDVNGNPMGKYAKLDENGKYAGPYGIFANGKYLDEKGNLIDNKKSDFGVLGFNPFGKNGKFKEFDSKNPDVVSFYNKLYGKFSNTNDSKFPYFFKFDKNGNIVPLNSMLKLLNPYDPMFKKLFKINVKGRLVPNDSPLNPQFRAFFKKDKDGKTVPKKFLEDMNPNTHFSNKIFDGSKFNPFDYGLGNKYSSPNPKKYFDEIYGKFKNPNNEKFNDLYKFNEKGKIVPKDSELSKLNPFSDEFIKNYEFNKSGKIIPRANPKSPIFNDYYSTDSKDNILQSKALKALEKIKKFDLKSPELNNYFKALFGKFMDPNNKNFKKYFKYDENGKLNPQLSVLATMNPNSPSFKSIFKITASGKLIPKENPQSPFFKNFYKNNGGNIKMKDFLKNLDLNSLNFNVNNNFKTISLSYGRPFNVEDPSILKHFNNLHTEFMNPKSPYFNQFFELDKNTNKIVPKVSELKTINPDHEDFLDSYEFNRFGRIIPRSSPTNPNFKLFYNTGKDGKLIPKEFLMKNALDYFSKAFNEFRKTFAAIDNKGDNANKSKEKQEKDNSFNNTLKNSFDLLFGQFKNPGDPNFEKFFKFDNKGKIVPKESSLNLINPNDFQKFNKNFELDKNGVALPRSDTNSPFFKLFYKVDEKGNIIPNELFSSVKGNLPSLARGNEIRKDFNINKKDYVDLFKRLYSKYMDKNNPNFKVFFKVDANSYIIPRFNKLKYLDPENRDFKKYYEFDINGNIIPRMSFSNPNHRLFFKLDNNGNLVPNNYLLNRLGDNAAALFKKDSEEYKKYLEDNLKRKKNSELGNNSNNLSGMSNVNNVHSSKNDNDKNGNKGNYNSSLNVLTNTNSSQNAAENANYENSKSNSFNGLSNTNGSQIINGNTGYNDSLNKKLEKDGIKVSISQDSNGNDIISLSARKNGDYSSNPSKLINLPTPKDNRPIISIGKKPILVEDPEIEDKTCQKNKLPTIEGECDKNDIYCLCRNHPQYKDCVCLAFPKSIICNNNYCQEHKESYECNPSQCDTNSNCNNCYCKNNMDDVKCKCKVNPFDKDCFCLQYPLSHMCNENACKINPNTLFCSCKTNLRNRMCTPRYCFDNPENVHCKCIVNPLSPECKCLNDPTVCDKKKFMEAITDFDLKIRDDCSKNKLFYSVNPFLPRNETADNTNYIVYNNQTEKLLVDPQIVFNMYYPPCVYNPDSPNKGFTGKDGKSPCIPFPAPPKLCKNTKTSELEKLGISLGKPCINTDGGPCIDNKTYLGKKLLRNANPIFIKRYNKINFYNVKEKFHVDERLPSNVLMVYNKLLLFNTKSEKKAMKLFLN